jgi:hypothetical protein
MMPRAPRGFPPQVSLWKLRLLPFAQLAYGRSPRLQIQRDARLALTKVDRIPDVPVRLEDLAHVKSAGPRI